MEFWIPKTRDTLLKSEKENVTSRLIQWESIVNECTKNEHMRAFKCVQSALTPLPRYTQPISATDMNSFLSLILQWTGLKRKMSHPSKVPKTYKEYLQKSKNWMNGSRAKHYSRTLYPHMIDCAKYYAQNVANLLFPIDRDSLTSSYDGIPSENSSVCNPRSLQKQCNDLFRDLLMYSYLVQFAQCRLRVTKTGRRVHLLCDNSMTGHKSNPMARMLQKYAQTHPYVDQFPSHREEIVDYFNGQKEASFNELFLLYQKRKTMEYTNEHQLIRNTRIHSENILHLMDFIKTNSKSEDGTRVNIDSDAFQVIMSVGVTLEQQQKENEQRITDLQQYIHRLETKQKEERVMQHPQPQPQAAPQWNQIQYQDAAPCAPSEPIPYSYSYSTYASYAPSSEPFIVNEVNVVDDINMPSAANNPMHYPFAENCFNGKSLWDNDPSMCPPFGSRESSIASNLNNFVSNFPEFERDDSTIMPLAMSVDNNLLFNSQNNDNVYTNCNSFNDSDLKYEDMHLSSVSNHCIANEII